MLKRSKLLALFLVVTVLCASVGFAAVQDTLTVNGGWNMLVGGTTGPNGEPDPDNPFQETFDADVYFSAIAVDDASTAADKTKVTVTETVDVTANVDTLEITIADGTFTEVGQNVIVKATVNNASTAQAADVVAAVVATKLEGFATVTAQFAGSERTTIAAKGETDGTVELTITITLYAIPDKNVDNATFTVNLTATAGDAVANG